MKACATASGGVIFIPETLGRKQARNSNDNSEQAGTAQNNQGLTLGKLRYTDIIKNAAQLNRVFCLRIYLQL